MQTEEDRSSPPGGTWALRGLPLAHLDPSLKVIKSCYFCPSERRTVALRGLAAAPRGHSSLSGSSQGPLRDWSNYMASGVERLYLWISSLEPVGVRQTARTWLDPPGINAPSPSTRWNRGSQSGVCCVCRARSLRVQAPGLPPGPLRNARLSFRWASLPPVCRGHGGPLSLWPVWRCSLN